VKASPEKKKIPHLFASSLLYFLFGHVVKFLTIIGGHHKIGIQVPRLVLLVLLLSSSFYIFSYAGLRKKCVYTTLLYIETNDEKNLIFFCLLSINFIYLLLLMTILLVCMKEKKNI